MTLRPLAATFLALSFALTPAAAIAATLSTGQSSAIVSLLRAFGADGAVISYVEQLLSVASTTIPVPPPLPPVPPPPVPPAGPSCTMSVTPANIVLGQSAMLSWQTASSSYFSINQGIGSVAAVAAGSLSIHPATSTTYTGTAVGTGTVTCSASIAVVAPSAVASAALDPLALASSAATRVLSGSATGFNTLAIRVYNRATPTTFVYNNTAVPVVEGGWTINPPTLTDGTYLIDILDASSTLLAEGQFSVAANAAPASAYIDSTSLASTAATRVLSGSATGLGTVRVIVYADLDPDTWTYNNNSVPVNGGTWQIGLGNLAPGTYEVEVHTPSNTPSGANLLATGSFSVSGAQANAGTRALMASVISGLRAWLGW